VTPIISRTVRTSRRENGTPIAPQERRPAVNVPLPPPASSTLEVVTRFGEAVNRHDLTTVSALLTDDTVFENTGPSPDGARHEGKTAVAAFWERWLAANPGATFETEDVVVAGDHCTVRWVYRKTRDGQPWHLRGVDLFTVRGGKVAAKFSYVKG
jgi:ketosteroid isomerase-like protein